MWDVFISHAHEDKDYIVRQLADKLVDEGLKVWYDEFELNIGDSLRKSIDDGLANSQYGIVVLSKYFFSKDWPQEELNGLVAKGSKILPLWHYISNEEVASYSPTLADKIAIDTSTSIDEVVAKILSVVRKKDNGYKKSKNVKIRSKLCNRLTNDQWSLLEQSAIRAVKAGGMAAMGFYRQTLAWPSSLGNSQGSYKNPSTMADVEATSAILHTIDSLLAPLARKLGCPLILLGEETKYEELLKDSISQSAFESIKKPEEFFIEEDNSIRVIFDGVDGTGNFVRGIPLFCSAVAILIGNEPRVAAIYDPIHHVVTYGSLKGDLEDQGKNAVAISWEIATGNRTDLVKAARESKEKILLEEAIGVHFTRSNPNKLHEFLSPNKTNSKCALEQLALESGGIYANNSGLISMTEVAKGSLGAFVNNITNLWDVAAGEVLVRACCGCVTDLDNCDINYSHFNQVSIIAARKELHARVLSLAGNSSSGDLQM